MKETNALMGRRGFIGCGALVLLPYASTVFAAAPAPAPAPAQPTIPLSRAINRSGRMRALSQRMSKAYVQGSLGVLPDKARDIQSSCQQLLTASLGELGGSSMSTDTRRLLQILDKDVHGLIDVAGTPRKDPLEVARTADTVLEGAEKLTKSFEQQSQQNNARIVNVAGRQRMLSQRAARAYFLMAAGHDTPAVRTQMTNARNDFNQGLATLQSAAISTPAIRNELELAKTQWMFYENSLNKAANPDTLQTLATTSERVYEVMDNLTALYDAALRDLLG